MFRDGHVLAVAEYLGSSCLEAVEDPKGGMPVGVVRPDLDDGYIRGKRRVGEILEPWWVTLRPLARSLR